MKLFRKVNELISRASAYVLAPAMSVFAASPAFAEGFKPANTVMQKVALGLRGCAAITITVAVVWVGYKTLLNGQSLRDCVYIIIGSILIGGGSEFAALLIS